MRSILFVLVACVPSCTAAPWREAQPPFGPACLDGAEDVRVRFADGNRVVMASAHWVPEIAPPVLEGLVAGDVWRVPLSEVVGLETRRTEPLRVVANTVVAVVVVAGVVALAVCTRSCPDLGGLGFGSSSRSGEHGEDGQEGRDNRR